MDLKIAGKLAVVTGSTGDGIGRAIALELARQGAVVVVNGRSQSTVDETVNQISETCAAAKAYGVVGDLGTEEGVQGFIAKLENMITVSIQKVGLSHIR